MRALYRFYLYTVFISLCVYATYVCSQLFSTLLRFTPLRASYETRPAGSDLVQALTFALVSFVVVLLIGGLHYWLIRRDSAQDAGAGRSAIRSFFLNTTEGIAAAIGLPLLGFSLLTLASSYDTGLPLAFALSTLLLALLLELERRRIATPTRGASAAFLHLHTYGVQAILLIVLGLTWSQIILPLTDGLLFGGRAQAESCAGSSYCPHYNLFLLVLAGLWFVAIWLFYGWLTSRDSSRVLRFILHGLGFAVGIGLVLAGLHALFTVLLLFFFQAPVALSAVLTAGAHDDFVSLLSLGLLVAAIYHVWMRAGVRRGLLPTRASLRLIELAICSVLTAATFWWGIGNLLYNTFALLLRFSQPPERESWLSAGAFALAGCISIAIEFYLRRKNRSEPDLAAGPRRAQVLALLAIGILTFSIAIATTLYIGLTTALNSPITNWTQVLSIGLSTLLVGLPLAGFYLYAALNEHHLGHLGKTAQPLPAPAGQTANLTEQDETAVVESVLSQLLANQITREQASDRLLQLMRKANAHELPGAQKDQADQASA